MTNEQRQATAPHYYTEAHGSLAETLAVIAAYGKQLAQTGMSAAEVTERVEHWQGLAEIEWASVHAKPIFDQHAEAQTVLVQYGDDYVVVTRDGASDGYRFAMRELDARLAAFIEAGQVAVIDSPKAQAA